MAATFEQALGRSVKAIETPKDQWLPALAAAGFSPKAAVSMAAMTDITLKNAFHTTDAIKGKISLDEYIRQLVNRVPSREPVLSGR